GHDLLVAHNAHQFDMPVLKRLAAGLPGAEDLRVFDSYPLARALEPGSKRLPDLARRFGIDPGTSHRALDDSLTLAGVFPELERLRQTRARKSARVELLDELALAMVLDPGAQTEEASLLLELSRITALGRFSTCLERYQQERERLGEAAASIP